LLNFHTVRSTKAIVYTAPLFVQESGNLSLRFAEHLAAQPDYPEPMHYLTFNGKYFFRNARLRHLRHLRLEQFNRYCIILDKASAGTTSLTSENTIDEDDSVNPYRVLDADHRNYDPTMEGTAAGTIFPPFAVQQRGRLHSHTLCWFTRKLRPRNWEPVPPISATRQGVTAKQRSITAKPLLKLTTDEFQEDSLYQLSEIARISGEMPRPDVSTTSSVKWGGYDWDSLRIAGLARGVLTKLNYMHVCTPASCLLNRASCRFFFPWCVAFEAASLSTRKLFANHLHVVCFKGHWPQQPYQVYDENTQRLALRRQLCDDDQWVTQ